ncbi:MAG: hypothetical protein WCP69_02085 [Bacteroidota bacterium]
MTQLNEYIKVLITGKKESYQINRKQTSASDNSFFRLIFDDLDRVKNGNYGINTPNIKWTYSEENHIDIDQMINFLNNELNRLNGIPESSENIIFENFCDSFKANLIIEFFDNL